jgi:hypothetical protein
MAFIERCHLFKEAVTNRLEQIEMDLGDFEPGKLHRHNYGEIPLAMSPELTRQAMTPEEETWDKNAREALFSRIQKEIYAYRNGNERGLPVTNELEIPEYVLVEALLPDRKIYSNPGELRQILDKIDEWYKSNGAGTVSDVIQPGDNKTRMAYNGQAPRIFEMLAQGLSFNRPIDPDREAGNINLAWPEMRELRRRIMEDVYGGKNPPIIILPTAREPYTARLAIEYASGVVGGENVIPISAGLCDITSERMARAAEEMGTYFANQIEILRCVNWQMVGERYGLPYDPADPFKPPVGTKGLTMYAGLLLYAAIGGLKKGKDVVFTDTDIKNLGQGGYDPLAYLGIPYLFQKNSDDWKPSMACIARTGLGRNNEPVTLELNRIFLDETLDPEIRRTALLMATQAWPLTGERRIDGRVIRQMPWCTGMGIEVQINAIHAGMAVNERELRVAQVFDPMPKKEFGESLPPREFALIFQCALWAEYLLRFCSERSVYPHQIGEAGLIADFNNMINRPDIVAFVQSKMHAPNTPARISSGNRMLPSIEELDAQGLVDWDAIARIGRRWDN